MALARKSFSSALGLAQDDRSSGQTNLTVASRFIFKLVLDWRRWLRKSTIQHRPAFTRGVLFGLSLVVAKFVIFLPIDIADLLYAVSLLVTLVITFGDFMEWESFVLHPRSLDFVLGFLFPLDAYAVVVLLGVPMPD